MNTAIQLDLSLALKSRNEGLALVEDHNQIFIEAAREIARRLCRERGEITGDDVRQECNRLGIYPKHYNCYGAIFRNKEFEAVDMTVSRQVGGHGNRVWIWRLR